MKHQPHKFSYVIGIDEVGRGPIAGPVTIGLFCVSLKDSAAVKKALKGITDSKLLTESTREAYVKKIRTLSPLYDIHYLTSSVSAKIIDSKGISQALRSAIVRSLKRLPMSPEECTVLLDGGLKAPSEYQQKTIIKGDQKEWVIGAASVVAKVHRDHLMVRYAKKYPEYGFERHKGYGTKKHYENIKHYGLCPLHRTLWIRS